MEPLDKEDFDLTSAKYEVTGVEPIYNFKNAGSGFFYVHFDKMTKHPFKLSFISFVEHLITKDEKLLKYLAGKKFDTTSHAVEDLYEIGYPVVKEVQAYMEKLKESVDPLFLEKMYKLLVYLKNFNDNESKGYDDKEDT
jgi:hypothetical protein